MTSPGQRRDGRRVSHDVGPAPRTAFDPLGGDAQAKDHLAEVRALGRVWYSTSRDCWVLTGLSDVEAAFRMHDVLSSADGVGARPSRRGPRAGIVNLDPPTHTRIRGVVHRSFTPRAIAGYRPLIRQVVARQLDIAAREGTFDVVDLLARPLPFEVIAAVIGAEAEELASLLPHIHTIADNLNGVVIDRSVVRGALEAIGAHVNDGLARAQGDDRSILDVLGSALAGDSIDLVAAQDLCAVLIAAGTHTTVNLIANAVNLLLDHPLAAEALWKRPETAAEVVEETLRHDPPVQAVFRTATQPIEFGGCAIAAGDRVCLMIAAANRDPTAFDRPDAFEPGRSTVRSVALGAGIHHCLGASLARLEAQEAISGLAQRAPGLTRAGTPQRSAGAVLRGFATLPVAVPLGTGAPTSDAEAARRQ